MTDSTLADEVEEFDFEQHGRSAAAEYRDVRGTYIDFAATVERLLVEFLKARSIQVHSVQSRGKTVESLCAKAMRPSKEDSNKPKYEQPMLEIDDQAGCRVITHFLKDVPRVGEIVRAEFEVLSSANRSAFLRDGGTHLGYESMHYVVALGDSRRHLPEYARFAGMRAELQVRTILQHAWAEIEHDIQYRATDTLPAEIRRRFLALAGMVEVSDREFQAISDAYEDLRSDALQKIERHQYAGVEITPETLKAYLDQRVGADGRMSEFSYAWTAANLRKMGFKSIAQVDQCVQGIDDGELSRNLRRTRLGQLSRFDDMVAAGMGSNFAALHPWATREADGSPPSWLTRYVALLASALSTMGVGPRSYDPGAHEET